jgi:hypothetical protein
MQLSFLIPPNQAFAYHAPINPLPTLRNHRVGCFVDEYGCVGRVKRSIRVPFLGKEGFMMTRGLLAASCILLLISAAGFAQGFRAGDYTFTLAGAGVSDDDLVNNDFSVNAAVSYFFTDAWEIAVRDNIILDDQEGSDDDWANTFRIALDWNCCTSGAFVPFIGASIGYTCGDRVEDTCLGGPEGGFRWFVNETTYILLMAEYLFDFDGGGDIDDSFDDGQFLYTLGIGFKF